MAWLAYIAVKRFKNASTMNQIVEPGDTWSSNCAAGRSSNRDYELPEYNKFYGYISVISHKSEDHAIWLAKRAYAYWLNKIKSSTL